MLVCLSLMVHGKQRVTADLQGICHSTNCNEQTFQQQKTHRTGADRDRRPDGTLLLNMLIKDEAQHLKRTLPKWAKVIDYWIIGVDDHNTDNSEEIILQYLGHIPGEIVKVAFDGILFVFRVPIHIRATASVWFWDLLCFYDTKIIKVWGQRGAS